MSTWPLVNGNPKLTETTHPSFVLIIDLRPIRLSASTQAVDRSMDVIVPTLLGRFSSEQGYKLFDDAIPTRAYLHSELTLVTGFHRFHLNLQFSLSIAFYLISYKDRYLAGPRTDHFPTSHSQPIERAEREGWPCEQHRFSDA